MSIKYLEKIHGRIDEEDDVIKLNDKVLEGVYGAVPSSKKSISQKLDESISIINLNTTDYWENMEMPSMRPLGRTQTLK